MSSRCWIHCKENVKILTMMSGGKCRDLSTESELKSMCKKKTEDLYDPYDEDV